MKKYIAELTKRDGSKEKIEIKKEWIDDIVFAIKSQFYVKNNKTGFELHGAKYSHVDIYEVQQ